MIFIRGGIVKNMRANLPELEEKMNKILKGFEKIVSFFDKILISKLTFSHLDTTHFWAFSIFPESISPCKITPVF